MSKTCPWTRVPDRRPANVTYLDSFQNGFRGLFRIRACGKDFNTLAAMKALSGARG